MDLVSLKKAYVNHWHVFFHNNIATLVVMKIAPQVHRFVQQRVQFFVPVELVFPVLPFAEIQPPVVNKTLIARALHLLYALMVHVQLKQVIVSEPLLT